jgi:hypothetical protein
MSRMASPRFQFSIRRLLGITTAVAIVLGGLSYLPGNRWLAFSVLVACTLPPWFLFQIMRVSARYRQLLGESDEPYQFRLSTLLWIALASAVCAGVLRAIGDDPVLMFCASAVLGVTGFTCMMYGAKMIDGARGETRPALLTVFGFLLVVAALVSGCHAFS